ncbi:MAG: ABC transporter substrate-binding protein, partial [Woeseia sp.]
MPMRRHAPRHIFALLAALLFASLATAQDWDALVAEAAGQTVYFNAWGGDQAINRYIEWAAERVREDYDIELRHVRVTDIAESVTRILAERAAGRNDGGSADLLWINGENFAALKRAGLLYGPWAMQLPNAANIDGENTPTTVTDGSLATEGYDLPWGTAALTFFFDTARLASAPRTPDELLAWIEQHPGRFSYPQPPAFLGSAF